MVVVMGEEIVVEVVDVVVDGCCVIVFGVDGIILVIGGVEGFGDEGVLECDVLCGVGVEGFVE